MNMEEIENPPFAVLFPGQRRHSKDAPYNFRHSVDPRLGKAQRLIKSGLLPDPDKLNLDDDDAPPKSRPLVQKKRKLKGHSGDYKLPRSRLIMTVSEEVMSKEEAKLVMARVMEKYSSKEFLLKSIQSYQQSIKDWTDNEEQAYRAQDIGCAKAAVEFYNKNHGTDYEIVETLGSYSKPFNGLLYHCNFRAQHKCLTNSGSHPSPKLFFAELLNALTPEAVKLCVILDDTGPWMEAVSCINNVSTRLLQRILLCTKLIVITQCLIWTSRGSGGCTLPRSRSGFDCCW